MNLSDISGNLRLGWLAALAGLVTLTAAAGAQESPVINLSTNTCIVVFSVPATWSVIKGDVKKFTGWARFGRPGDLNTLRGVVEVNVPDLTTRSEDRDHKWFEECLEGSRFPKITFTLEQVKVTENQSFLMAGQLVMRDITRPVVIGGQFTVEDGRYHLTGGCAMKWTDYGVHNPSTMFTKVQPDMKVLVELWLPLK